MRMLPLLEIINMQKKASKFVMVGQELTIVELKCSSEMDFSVRVVLVRQCEGPTGGCDCRGRGRGEYLPNSGQERLRVSAALCS